jgi:tetrahydromethanopterin S-methyltransferase subunit E
MLGKSLDFLWKLFALFCVLGIVYIVIRFGLGYFNDFVPGLLKTLSHWWGICNDLLNSQPYIFKRLTVMGLIITVILIYKNRNKS